MSSIGCFCMRYGVLYICLECECHKCCDNKLVLVTISHWGVSDAVDPIGSSIVK